MVNKRRIQNRITQIRDASGKWIDDYSQIEQMAKDYFANIYSRQNDLPVPDIVEDLRDFQIPSLQQEDLSWLSQPFTQQDIDVAISQIKGDKAPGPDGFPALFSHHYWELVKSDVSHAVLSFLTRGHLLKELNKTLITLIPKILVPNTFKDLRPIGLCNTVYKIISKCLVNRLQPLMDKVITPFQNGFIKGGRSLITSS